MVSFTGIGVSSLVDMQVHFFGLCGIITPQCTGQEILTTCY
jgi:hypothetical protein